MKNLIYTRKDLKSYLKADFEAFGFKYPYWIARLTYGENAIMYKYMRILRHLEYYTNKKQCFLDKLFKTWYLFLWRRLNIKLQLYIKPNIVGKGCALVHHGFRRIGSITSIGENCTILPLVLIGRKHPDADVSQSVIGDNCYIGAGTIIMTPITIGSNVIIGAGSVVTHDIPSNSVVAGNPAKILYNNQARVKNEIC